MRNKKLGILVALSASLMSQSLMAAALIPFTNGNAADANDVNANFNELATRIDNISAGGGSAGVDFEAYKHSYSTKSFSVKGQGLGWNTEKRDFQYNGSNEMVVTKNRSRNATVVSTIKQTYSYGTNEDTVLTKEELGLNSSYCFNSPFLLPCKLGLSGAYGRLEGLIGTWPGYSDNVVMTNPGIILTKANMRIGEPWNSSGAAETTRTIKTVTSPATSSIFIDTGTLVSIEGVSAGGKSYTDCLKIEYHRSGDFSIEHNFRKVAWYCKGQGLVKEVQVVQAVVQAPSAQDPAITFPIISNKSRIIEFLP